MSKKENTAEKFPEPETQDPSGVEAQETAYVPTAEEAESEIVQFNHMIEREEGEAESTRDAVVTNINKLFANSAVTRRLIKSKADRTTETAKVTEKKVRKSPIEITLEAVDAINDLRGLEILAYTCHRKGLLTKINTAERRWRVEVRDGVEGSEKLVKAIMRKQKRLLNKLYEAIELKNEALRRIDAVSDIDELDRLAWKCHEKGLVKKIFTSSRNEWKVEEIKDVVGSKNIAQAIMAKKEKIEKQEEDREFASNIADISSKYGKTSTGNTMTRKEAYRGRPNKSKKRSTKEGSVSKTDVDEFMQKQAKNSPTNSIGDVINPGQVSRLSKQIKKDE